MKSEKHIKFLLARNLEQSKLFSSPDAVAARRLYRQQHPTEIIALKCMDGRLNLSVMTQTPPGIIQPFRELGGKFDPGNPYLAILLQDLVDYAVSKGRRVVIFVTYHFSSGDKHRGCAGFVYDTEKAKSEAEKLKITLEKIFGKGHSVVHPIRVGIETDKDALIFHRNGDEDTLDISEHLGASEEELRVLLVRMYPDMRPDIADDLLPLLVGNQRHVKEMSKVTRPGEDIVHRECVLGIGRGFNWLHELNKALLVGPYSSDLSVPINTAATLLLGNLNDGRISKEDGVVVMTSGVYGRRENTATEKLFAAQKVRSLARVAARVIEEEVPDLWPSVNMIGGVVDLNTLLFTPIPLEGDGWDI